MSASTRVLGDMLGNNHGHISSCRMATAEAMQHCILKQLKGQERSDYKMCALSLDETEMPALTTGERPSKQRTTESLFMFHSSWFQRRACQAPQFEVPAGSAILKDNTKPTSQKAMQDRMPLSYDTFVALSKYLSLRSLSSDAAKSRVSLSNALALQTMHQSPAVLVSHSLCLFHEVNLVVCSFILLLKLLSPVLCGNLFLQKNINLANLRRTVKASTASMPRTGPFLVPRLRFLLFGSQFVRAPL